MLSWLREGFAGDRSGQVGTLARTLHRGSLRWGASVPVPSWAKSWTRRFHPPLLGASGHPGGSELYWSSHQTDEGDRVRDWALPQLVGDGPLQSPWMLFTRGWASSQGTGPEASMNRLWGSTEGLWCW